MQSFVDMLTKSVRNAQLIDKSKLQADPDEFYKTLFDVTRTVDKPDQKPEHKPYNCVIIEA
jgi:hypothetical protein